MAHPTLFRPSAPLCAPNLSQTSKPANHYSLNKGLSVMTVITTYVNLRLLKAMSVFGSKEAPRYYLQGVNIEIRPDHLLLVATDGHRMMIAKQQADSDGASEWGRSLIVPTAACAPFKLTHRDLRDNPFAVLVIDTEALTATFRFNDSLSTTVKLIDGTFPDWRRVLPAVQDMKFGEVDQYNWHHVASFQKFAEDLQISRPYLRPHGGGPAAVLYQTSASDKFEAFGVLMPMRGTEPPFPTWLPPYAPPLSKPEAA